MILRMTSMLPGIPLEKRGFLRRMGFMEGTTIRDPACEQWRLHSAVRAQPFARTSAAGPNRRPNGWYREAHRVFRTSTVALMEFSVGTGDKQRLIEP